MIYEGFKTGKTYEEVGSKTGLNPNTLKRYVYYMRTRWSDPKDEELKCTVGYAGEWAERFRQGFEYQYSDKAGQALLDSMAAGDYGQ